MIVLTTHRQYAESVLQNIFPFIKLLKESHIKNVAHHSRFSGEFLTVKLINSLLDETELIIKKKLINTIGMKVNIKLSDAAGIALYKTLLILPLNQNQEYLDMIRNEWISVLDKQIFTPVTGNVKK